MRNSRLVERYIVAAILPYTLLSLALLTAILFLQQAGHYTEWIFQGVPPPGFLYNLSLALIPAVLVFTLPPAVLAGTIIGFGRMGSDSEIVALRAAGVGTWRMLWPALALGLIATCAAGYLNLKEAPRAQQLLRRVGLRAALYRLESPVEPRSFTTEIPGYVIYVHEGDKSEGKWGRVFIYWQEGDQPTRLVTARSGRLDSSADKSELVLEDAVKTQLPGDANPQDNSYVVERFSQFRIQFNTGRQELMARLAQPKQGPDELQFGALRKFLATSRGREKRDAETILHKRLTFTLSPFFFALFGSALALRVRRGSRGFGVLLSLGVLIVYYLITLAGEQMTRAGTLRPLTGAWLGTALITVFSVLLLLPKRLPIGNWFRRTQSPAVPSVFALRATNGRKRGGRRLWLSGFPTLLDVGTVRSMCLTFALALVTLVAIFNIFTLFELWRFVAWNRDGLSLIAQYLFYLLPLVSVELCPPSILIAALVTYALTSRRSEAIAWWAAGQSVYRLMLPGLAFSAAIAAGLWIVQERAMPMANIRQDTLRARLRGTVAQVNPGSGKRWLVSANGNRIYSYEFDDRGQVLLKPVIYDFDSVGVHLKRVTTGEEGKWLGPHQLEIKGARWLNLEGQQITREAADRFEMPVTDPPSVFQPNVGRPSQLSAAGLHSYIRALKARGADTAPLAVALQHKYAEPFNVIVMALLGMPLAISFGRKSAVVALCSAVGASLAFWLISGGFQQLGLHGLLPAAVAAWAPIAIFAGGGLYFVSRVRT
jgi:LPS export ABC transporter permease LptF/LPS export ABC transporter permease LptG